jgi:hypothetical protein
MTVKHFVNKNGLEVPIKNRKSSCGMYQTEITAAINKQW